MSKNGGEAGSQRKPKRGRLSGPELERIVGLAKDGDVSAFQQLYTIYGERILNYIFRLTGSREDAEDLTQDTFVLAFRKLPSLKDNRKVQSWLYRIAQNNVFQKYRAKTPQIESLDQTDTIDLTETTRVSSPGKNPEDSVLSQELKLVVEKIIASLPAKYREVFILAAIHKLSYQEISEIVERSLASVKSDIHRARVAVRDQIKEYLGENYGMSKL